MEDNGKYRRRLLINFGKVLMDVGKLTFGSLVLGSIIKGEFEASYLITIGASVAMVAVFIGILLTSKKEI
jgi:hypothetical protein